MRFSMLVVKNLSRRKTRSLLTLGGLAIAVAALVSLVGVAAGFESSFMDYYLQRHVDLVVQRDGSSTEAMNNGLPEQLEHRIAEVPGVQQVVGRLIDAISFEGEDIYGVVLNGWRDDSPLFDRLTMLSGRRFVAGETSVAIVGRVLAANLGKQVGDDIELYSQPFKIAGIYESPTVFENGGVVIPLAQLQSILNRPGKVTGFAIVAKQPISESQLGDLRRQITELQPQLKVTRAADFVHNLSEIQMSRAVAWCASTIALLIGAIGVSNTMLMSVLERVNEIGLLRAIGWRKSRIARMIIAESMLLTVSGAVAGCLGGVLLVKLLSRMPAVAGLVEGKVGLSVILQAFIVAIGVGLLGAVYPAIWGARLLPAASMRRK